MLNCLFQLCVRMSADDQVDIRHLFCKDLILRFVLILPGSSMGHTSDHIHFFIFSDLFYCLFYGLNRILEL